MFPVSGDIKDYFGERIGLYFLFVQYFATALLVPATLGVMVFAIQTYYNVTGYFLMPVFAAYMTVWSSYFVEMWRQAQSTAAMEWGVAGKQRYACTGVQPWAAVTDGLLLLLCVSGCRFRVRGAGPRAVRGRGDHQPGQRRAREVLRARPPHRDQRPQCGACLTLTHSIAVCIVDSPLTVPLCSRRSLHCARA